MNKSACIGVIRSFLDQMKSTEIKEERIIILSRIYNLLQTVNYQWLLEDDNFNRCVYRKIKEILTDEPGKTYPFLHLLIYKYFYWDDELMYKMRTIRKKIETRQTTGHFKCKQPEGKFDLTCPCCRGIIRN